MEYPSLKLWSDKVMNDALFILIVILFFLVTYGLLAVCQRLMEQ